MQWSAPVVLFVLFASVGPSGAGRSASRGTPNYVEDSRPSARHLEKDFDHPYPIVQESDDYEKDFVRDENKDNGEWQAQFQYDKLRRQLLKEIREMEAAGKALYGEDWEKVKQDLKNAKGGYQGALDAQKEAKQRLSAAEEKVKVAKANVKQAEGDAAAIKGSDEMPMKQEVADAKAAVAAAEARVKEAEQRLAKAQQDLQDVLDKQQKAAAAQDAGLSKAVTDAQDKLRIAKQKRNDALSEKEAADALLDGSLKHEENAKRVKEEDEKKEKVSKSNKDALQAAYDKELADVERVKAQLDAAAKKVKALRDAEDNKGGVTQGGHGGPGAVSFWRSGSPLGASTSILSLSGVVLAVLAATC